MDFATIPIIVAICAAFMSVLKLFTKGNTKEEEILTAVVPCFGALLTLILYFVHSEYMLEFSDPLVAIMIGFVSGQAALETKSTFDYIKSKKEIKEELIQEVINTPEIITEIVNTDELQTVIQDVIKQNEENTEDTI
ncbi:MAG: hypothetical protein R3Y05_03915 [bacterium]